MRNTLSAEWGNRYKEMRIMRIEERIITDKGQVVTATILPSGVIMIHIGQVGSEPGNTDDLRELKIHVAKYFDQPAAKPAEAQPRPALWAHLDIKIDDFDFLGAEPKGKHYRGGSPDTHIKAGCQKLKILFVGNLVQKTHEELAKSNVGFGDVRLDVLKGALQKHHLKLGMTENEIEGWTPPKQ